jgi:holo-[acyl-carrier protein] synthase
MVKGIGVDVIEIPRLRLAIERWGDIFLRKIFTEREYAYSHAKKNQTQHFAARFAVKEAVSKAIAIGWSGGFRWKDVEVENDAAGKPSVILYGNVKKLLAGKRVHVSISHSETVVIAFVIIEGD